MFDLVSRNVLTFLLLLGAIFKIDTWMLDQRNAAASR